MPDELPPAVPVKRKTSARTAGALIGVLTALLGFAIAVQVRSNASHDTLANARDDDLAAILADQNQLAQRRRDQIDSLRRDLAQLQASGDKDGVAKAQAERETQSLNILLGTVAVSGPGVIVTITDSAAVLKAEDLLDVVEELRGAGAEAIQFGPVRVTTSTNFVDINAAVQVDGVTVRSPYVVRAIGDPKTMDTAMNIPGGVVASAHAAGGDAVVSEQDKMVIDVVRVQSAPRYASPTSK